MSNSNENTDYREGQVIAEMNVTKLENGFYKATSMGLEVNHRDQERAILDLQDQLQAGLLNGTLRPDM